LHIAIVLCESLYDVRSLRYSLIVLGRPLCLGYIIIKGFDS